METLVALSLLVFGVAIALIAYRGYKVENKLDRVDNSVESLKSLREIDLEETRQHAFDIVILSENDMGAKITQVENNLKLTIQRTCAQRGHAYKCYASSSADAVHPHTLKEKPVVMYYFECLACNHTRSKTENDLTIGEVRLCLDGRFALPKKLLKKKRYKVAQIKELAAQGLVLDR